MPHCRVNKKGMPQRPNGWMDQDATWYGGGLGPGDILLDGDLTPPTEKNTAPNFRPMSIVAKRLYVSGYHLVQYSLGDIV